MFCCLRGFPVLLVFALFSELFVQLLGLLLHLNKGQFPALKRSNKRQARKVRFVVKHGYVVMPSAGSAGVVVISTALV